MLNMKTLIDIACIYFAINKLNNYLRIFYSFQTSKIYFFNIRSANNNVD